MKTRIQQGWRNPGWLNYLLLPLSTLYVILVKIRQGCYSLGIFRSSQLPVPVIVVGSVSAGGSGKSPLVISLVHHFKAKGYRPGVIARGYGGKSGFWPREVNSHTNAELVGDEPQMIFEMCRVAVVVGPDRVQNGRYLVDKLECDVLISDDGFQHFALKRAVDIAVIDGEFGFGNGWCLPAGPLREPESGIHRAHIVVINSLSNAQFTVRCDALAAKTSGRERPCAMRMELLEMVNLVDNRRRNLSQCAGQRVHAVAGTGNPARFFSQLESKGIKITPHSFPDHHGYIEDDLRFGDERPVLMTEKDGIKCRNMAVAKNIWVVPARLHVDAALYQRVETLIR